MRIFLFLFIINLQLFSSQFSESEVKKMIGHMLIIGFADSQVTESSEIIKTINKYEIGGVILFDIFYNNKNINKNIHSPQQLKELTHDLQKYSKHPLLISIDQEGGRVARLKPRYGFPSFASAKTVSTYSLNDAHTTYKNMSVVLAQNGINCNFAPVVDLEINQKNKVIVGLERSFGKTSAKVSQYASIQLQEQRKQGILSVLKHFPGHGSSLGDSHLGFVDITDTWSPQELQPYKDLIHSNTIDMIMTAHVFHQKLDSKYPATLSYNINTKLLRNHLQYKGVIVSDDLQMGAITNHYSLKKTLSLAINSGVDILLFGNQLAQQNTDALIQTIYDEIQNGSINIQRIIESNKRIRKLHE